MSLEELIQLCKKEDRKAQATLYKKYASVLFGICLKYSRNKAEAEDNLHDCFMTIFEKIKQYKGKGSFEGWIKRIAVNTTLQKYRKEKHLQIVSENIGDTEEEEEEQEIDEKYASENLQTLLKYIQELPNKYRQTFNMYVLDGYSHNEISETLGTSLGASKSNLSRARKILKEKIEKNQKKAIIGCIILLLEKF